MVHDRGENAKENVLLPYLYHTKAVYLVATPFYPNILDTGLHHGCCNLHIVPELRRTGD